MYRFHTHFACFFNHLGHSLHILVNKSHSTHSSPVRKPHLSARARSSAWPLGGRGIHAFFGLSHSGFHSRMVYKSFIRTCWNSINGSISQTLFSDSSNPSCRQLGFSPHSFHKLWFYCFWNHFKLIVLAHDCRKKSNDNEFKTNTAKDE